MPKQTTITCDCCKQEFSAKHYARLWAMLKKQGWNKGPTGDTYFCEKPQCQEHRACMLREAEKTV